MKLKVFLLLFLPFFLVNNIILSQEKWSQDPRMTQIYGTGQYSPLPQAPDNYVNPNHNVRVVKTFNGTYLVNPNFRVHPSSNTTQSEVIICRDPNNQAIMFGSSNAVYPVGGFSFLSEGVYVSTNSGTNWFGWDSVHSTPLSGHGGDPGPTIDKNGTFIISHLGYPTSGMFANYSTDKGNTWSATYTIASGSQDKNFSGTDDASSSAYYGRSYTVWSWFSVSYPYIAISYTTNGGVSWSSPQRINTPPSSHYSQGCDIRVGPTGQVYVTWAAPLSGSLTEDYDGFAKSTNGGVNWTVVENAFDANGIRGYLSTKGNIRVNSFPRIDVDRSGGARNGWIYIVGCDKNLSPAGSDPDIILHRSSDGGTTWSAGIRVNQDPLNNGAIQFFPAVRVDESGGVNVVYYDDRNVGSNLVEVYMSRSTDGGSTWADILLTDHNFAPQPITGLAGGYSGDYIGITSGNGKIWPLWMDRSNPAYYQAWTTYVSYGPPPPLPAHDIVTGPFLSLPPQFVINNAYNIKTLVTNGGTSNESNVPIRFFVGSTLVNTTNKTLNSGQSDSVSNTWTPTSAGAYTLTYASGLANDTNRTNDTVRTTVQVLPGPLQTLYCDDFTAGSGNWTITNNGGVCIWAVRPQRGYQMPSTATGNCFSADVDLCGSGTSINSTATLNTVLNCSTVSGTFVEFDNDFYLLGADQCKLDVSTDGGSTWINKFTWTTSRRNTHETQALPEADGKNNVKVRITSIQPGWDWWWAVDNFCVKGYGYIGVANNQNRIPKEFSLSQNYPNPFNPTTVIAYELPKASSVKLVVYDMLGREVKTLVNEFKQAGSYDVSFDASSLASGVYFYRINAGSFTDVKKMMLIK
jgi:hypothetical protein